MSQIVLITGASSGIGKETAFLLLREGFSVYASARRTDKMEDLKTAGASIMEMDITNEKNIQDCVDRIKKEKGNIDILINNAGFGLYGAMEDTKTEDARYQFEVNIFGLARLTQLILPLMREQKKGKIVNIGSMGGKIYTPLGSWYHATKHALEGWTDCVRFEVKQFGIDVILIEPGIIQSEFGDIMQKSLIERSGNSPYRNLALKMSHATSKMYQNKNASPPAVVAKTVLKSIRAKKPKTRYAVGKYARLGLFARRILGDKLYDKALKWQIG
jgi:short-subunit dehydrogenase